MPEEYKLHLTRGVLFSAMPLVSFKGTYENGFDEKELLKAFKMLCAREPLVSSFVRMNEEDAFVVVGESAASIEFLDVPDEEAFFLERKNGVIDVFSHLFEFYVLNKKTLVIFANTAVADVKSLFISAHRLLDFYEKKTVNVSPEKVFVYSKTSEVPLNVYSVVIDKLASDMEMKWQKKPRTFQKRDYVRLIEKQRENAKKSIYLSYELAGDKALEIKELCNENGTDIATLCCYSFKNALADNRKFKKLKRKKLCFGADLRLYEDEPKELGVGPFFGRASVVKSPKKEIEKNGDFKAFHDNCYKKLTNAFYTYYNRVFFSSVSPSLCDAAEFYSAGLLKNKGAAKFAKSYSELYEPLMNFDFYNLDCDIWRALSEFKKISFYEQKGKCVHFAVTVFFKAGSLFINLEADEAFCSSEMLKAIGDEAFSNIMNPKF